MKFFKHFVDAHEGISMQKLMDKFGLEGYAAYFILMEICAAKLDKGDDELFTEAHCHFRISERKVREKLRMRSTKVELFLNSCATLNLLQFTKLEDEFKFFVPKLLESLDRDAKRARTERGSGAPKNKKKNKKEEEEVSAAINPRFNSVNRFNQQFNPVVREFAEYIGTLPISYRLKAHAVDVHRTFEEVSEFKKFISSVIDADKFQNLPTEESRQSYLTVSILRHCGVISA